MFGTRKLGRTSDQRKAMLRQLTTDLLENGKLETTFCRAKEVQPVAEKMITLGKKGDLAAYRQALAFITKEDVAHKVFKELAPKYADRNGGYTSDPHRRSPRRRCRDGHHRAGVREYRSTAAECKTSCSGFSMSAFRRLTLRRCAQFFTRHIV